MQTDIETRVLIAAAAGRAWVTFTPSEKNMVRSGIFPSDKMGTLIDEFKTTTKEATRLVAVALMDCAKADGGMRA